MTDKVLALIDASAESDASAVEAIRLAAEAGAPCILGIDPKNEPFERLTARLSHLLDLGAAAGVRMSTMLVNTGNVDAITRTARAHRIDLVVLEERQAEGIPVPEVLRAFESAQIPFVLVSEPARMLVVA